MTDLALSAAFSHVRAWVFDLDQTLYPPSARLFAQIERRMTGWITRELGLDAQAADRLRDTYWRRYGTTMSGLITEHGIDPLPFLHEVHDIDFSVLARDAALAEGIIALPGRKFVYTNGDSDYAARVLEARGLTGLFDAVYGVEHAGFRPKPDRDAYEAVFAMAGIAPDQGAMFEDDPRNLAVPHDLGMQTVLVGPDRIEAAHIHHHTEDLAGFLSQLLAGPDASRALSSRGAPA